MGPVRLSLNFRLDWLEGGLNPRKDDVGENAKFLLIARRHHEKKRGKRGMLNGFARPTAVRAIGLLLTTEREGEAKKMET